jgi:hypothetical protein
MWHALCTAHTKSREHETNFPAKKRGRSSTKENGIPSTTLDEAELNNDCANSTQQCSKSLPIPQFDRIVGEKKSTLALMLSSESETDLMEVEKRTEENRKVTFNPWYRHFYNACFDVHRDVNSTQFILEQFWAHLIYWWWPRLTQVKVERKKLTRAAENAKRIGNNTARQAARDKQKIPDDVDDDIREDRNSHYALSYFSATEMETVETETTVEEKSKVTLTHAIDIFGLRHFAPPELSIMNNIFFNNFRLI